MYTIKSVEKMMNMIKITTTDDTIITFQIFSNDTVESVLEDIKTQNENENFKFENIKSLETALRVLLKPNSKFRSIKNHVRI